VLCGWLGMGQGAVLRRHQKVEADTAVDSLAPRWFVEGYLQDLFEEDAGEHEKKGAEDAHPKDEAPVHGLPTAGDKGLIQSNRASEDWISRGGAQDRAPSKGPPGASGPRTPGPARRTMTPPP
jgi:hypothetical protein